MKKRTILQKLCAFFTVSALLLGTGSAIAPAVSAAAEPDAWHDDWLHVNDNAEIVDRNGNPVWLTGCNWFGYNVGSQVFDGVWSQNMHEMLTQIADHGFNLLRIPVSTELLLQWKNGDPDPATPKVNEWTNPELTKEGVVGGTVKYSFDICEPRQCLEPVLRAEFIGIPEVDLMSSGGSFCTVNINHNFNAQLSTPSNCLIPDIEAVFYRSADTTDPNNWKYAAEQAAAHVLKENPNLLVMVEGVEVYPKEGYDWTAPAIDWTTNTEYYYGTWWGGNFRGAKENPIDLGEYQSQLVYSPHDYGPLVYQQKWFYEGFTKETLLKDCWYDNWFYLLDEKVAPLLMGEWGGFIDSQHDPDGSNQKWMLALRDLMIENHIHHTFWCFNENSGDTGGLVYDNFGKWDEDKYALVEPALWQTDSGKFISLDHQTALGANGISLGDYYGGSTNPTDPTTPTESPIKGDANGDEMTNILDSMLIRRYLLNPKTILVTENADWNENNTVDLTDLISLNRFLLKQDV